MVLVWAISAGLYIYHRDDFIIAYSKPAEHTVNFHGQGTFLLIKFQTILGRDKCCNSQMSLLSQTTQAKSIDCQFTSAETLGTML